MLKFMLAIRCIAIVMNFCFLFLYFFNGEPFGPLELAASVFESIFSLNEFFLVSLWINGNLFSPAEKEQQKSCFKSSDNECFCYAMLRCMCIIFQFYIFLISAILTFSLSLFDFTKKIRRKSYKAFNIVKFLAILSAYIFLIVVYSIYLSKGEPNGLFMLCLCILRLLIETFIFFYYDLYVPKAAEQIMDKLDKRHKRFLRFSELSSRVCSSAGFCTVNDIEHILRSHSIIQQPTRCCNPAYWCNKEIYIGFHQTTAETSLLIAQTGFKCGKEGMFGGGIYFARTIDETMYKAHNFGAIICAIIDMGKFKIVNEAARDITIDKLREEGFDSVFAKSSPTFLRTGDELVVYEPERVIEWVVAYPDFKLPVSNEA
jgi:hypothetical protein